jgi:hypothetical protein
LTIKFGATVAYFQTNPDGKPNNRPTIWGCFIHSIYGDFGHGYWVYHMNVFDMFIHNWGDWDAPRQKKNKGVVKLIILWLFNVAMEHGPFSSMIYGWIFTYYKKWRWFMAALNNQRASYSLWPILLLK